MISPNLCKLLIFLIIFASLKHPQPMGSTRKINLITFSLMCHNFFVISTQTVNFSYLFVVSVDAAPMTENDCKATKSQD